VYQALQQAGFTTYVTPETANSAQRRDFLIAASLLTPLTTLTQGRYLRRWARRLRDFGFSREDSVILGYGSFGVDAQHHTFGAEVIVSADQPLIRHFHEKHDSIAQQFLYAALTGQKEDQSFPGPAIIISSGPPPTCQCSYCSESAKVSRIMP
jgi:hypothetical protein